VELKKVIVSNLLLTLAYVVSGELVSLLSLPPVGATPLWVPAGIAVAAVLIWGYRLLPGVFLGDLLVGFQLYGWNETSSISMALVLGVQSLLLASSARWLLVRFIGWPTPLVREQQILKFFLITAVIAAIIPAMLTTAGQVLFDKQLMSGVFNSFMVWWLGTAMGVVIACPLTMSLFAQPASVWRPRILSVSLPMIILSGLFLVILDVARDRENNLIQTRFDASASLVNSMIENELSYRHSLLRSMQAYFANSVLVTEQEFNLFLEDYADQKHDIGTLAWLEFLPAKQPQETDSDNDPASLTPQLVMKYMQSNKPERHVIRSKLSGLNFCSVLGSNLCVNGGADLNEAELVEISNSLPGLDTNDKFIHLLPVFNAEENLRGYVMQLIDDEALFSHLYQSQASAWLEFTVIRLIDGHLLFETSPNLMSAIFDADNAYQFSHLIQQGGHNWRIDYLPSQLFLDTHSNWSFFWIVSLALFLFSLTTIWLMTLTGRYKLIESEVSEKTFELEQRGALLANSEKKYRRLVESIQDEYFLYSHDIDGIFSYVSPSVELILGYRQEEFLQHYSTYMPETEVNRHVSLFTEHTLAGFQSNFELEILDKSGTLHTIAVTEFPSYNDDKEVVGVEGIARDITEFKASQKQLEKLSLAVEHSPNAIMVMDRSGQVEYVNPKFTAITGYSNEEKLGRWPDLINSGVNRSDIYEEIWQTIGAGRDWRGELQYRKKNGDLYWAQELIAPMLDNAGNVTHFVATQVDITEARRLSEETSFQATHDQLTGLINRHEFDLRLERVIQAAKHNLTEHALCFLDLDQFKLVNDTCGHIAGDELLRQIGNLLQTNVRSRDTIARLGGDEFAILMEHCTIDRAYKASEQVLKLLQDFRFHWQDYTFTVGGSIGLAIIDQHTTDSNEALKNVDTACYSAKDAGRNRVEIHREDSLRLQQRRGEIHWSTEINEALDDDRFLLYAQPIKPLTNPELGMSYEVLVRMLRKDGEISPPGAFLPAAERYNSISRIDRWVVSNTLAWISKHADKLGHVATVSINLSGLSLGDETMLSFISNELQQTDIPAEKIKFEITETAAIANLRAATKFIETMAKLGIRFSLDDFGSGLSSFAYLKKLQVDTLKIDGMFVKDMLTDRLDYEMVKSINEIGHVMGLETIAEFVENEEILEQLRQIGVDFVQGYGVGKPAPIDNILSQENK
jgi:diguanylate cyclase (GGDEF)-like protein/PAS domain S-box-containing protein